MTKKKYITILAYLFYILTILFLFKIRIIMVNGQSMYPTLKDKQICVAWNTDKINDGDVVVVDVKNTNLPTSYIVKRFYEDKSNEHLIWVEGDNKTNSLDSRSFGPLERNKVMCKVIFPFLSK